MCFMDKNKQSSRIDENLHVNVGVAFRVDEFKCSENSLIFFSPDSSKNFQREISIIFKKAFRGMHSGLI